MVAWVQLLIFLCTKIKPNYPHMTPPTHHHHHHHHHHDQVSEADNQVMTMALIVPPGASPGSILKVTIVDGTCYNVAVPPGVPAGAKFLVQVINVMYVM
jgi:hypothetical protein